MVAFSLIMREQSTLNKMPPLKNKGLSNSGGGWGGTNPLLIFIAFIGKASSSWTCKSTSWGSEGIQVREWVGWDVVEDGRWVSC